jgi:hypothetical protein
MPLQTLSFYSRHWVLLISNIATTYYLNTVRRHNNQQMKENTTQHNDTQHDTA